MLNKALRSKGASIAISSVMIMQTIAFMSAGVSADTADEKIENFVKRCYTVTLGREGEAEGIAFWTDQLASGNMVGSVLVKNFIDSEEYQAKGHTNEGYVNDLYTMFMGRQAESEGAVYWNQQLESGVTRDAVFAGFANSQEFDTLCKEAGITAGYFTAEYDINKVNGVNLFVERMYKTCLGRTGDQGGQAYWTQGLLNGSLTGIACAANFIQSDEYKSLDLSADAYVKNLYTAFMGREPDEGGAAYWANGINDGTYTKDDVFNGFAYSAEFAGICAYYGIVSGSDTAPANVDPTANENTDTETPDDNTPQVIYKLKEKIKTYGDGKKEVSKISVEKDGSQVVATTFYDKDGKELNTETEIDAADGKYIHILSDGTREEYDFENGSLNSYKPDGTLDKDTSYTSTTTMDKNGVETQVYTYLNGKLKETAVRDVFEGGYKTIYYDADGKPTFCIWQKRTLNDDNNTVTTYYNADGTVESYDIAELRKSDNAHVISVYDGSDKLLEKIIRTGEYHENEETYDANGKLIADHKKEYLDGGMTVSKETDHDYLSNTSYVIEYKYDTITNK